MTPRRTVLRAGAAGGLFWGLPVRLPAVSAAETKLPAGLAPLEADIAPVVRLLEETPRDRLIEALGARVRKGLSYGEVLAALLLAGVRNVQPRPVGFKFHAVLAVQAVCSASLASPDELRWLPLFWAVDNFKRSQAEEQAKTGFRMAALDEGRLPSARKARESFVQAMERWDLDGAELAAAALARSAGAHEAFELFCRYGARDFRDIGHKAIFVANAFRVLQTIGWRHAEPVLRSLARALLYYSGESPVASDQPEDRPWRYSRSLVGRIRPDWREGKPDAGATADLASALREASDEGAARKVVELLGRGVAPASLWDACFLVGAEVNLARPDILSLHALTTLNALRHAHEATGDDETRRLLLLQAAAFSPHFRGTIKKPVRLDKLEADGEASLEGIFDEIARDRLAAARRGLAYFAAGGDPAAFTSAAHALVVRKGDDAHAYKFSSAALEDASKLSPRLRGPFLAATTAHLPAARAADTGLGARVRAALG